MLPERLTSALTRSSKNRDSIVVSEPASSKENVDVDNRVGTVAAAKHRTVEGDKNMTPERKVSVSVEN